MHPFEMAFWIFFGAIALWIAWGFLWMFVLRRPDRWDPPVRRPARSGAGGAADSPETLGLATASVGMTDLGGGDAGSGESGGGESGGGDSGGGGDYSGGGGESGGGGSSGGW